MADIRAIRRQIRGVENIAKITRAMEMIATSKMRRAQEAGLAGRPYAERIYEVLADLAGLEETGREPHPLLERRPVNRIALVLDFLRVIVGLFIPTSCFVIST